MSLVTCSTIRQELSFPVNINLKEDRDRLEQYGREMAAQRGLKYEGYSVNTTPPYAIEKALPTLFFIEE